ncbi:hypothetical protein JCM8097_001406 [Rhodosporidiobolus ruineniae]
MPDTMDVDDPVLDDVVMADLQQPLPSSSPSASSAYLEDPLSAITLPAESGPPPAAASSRLPFALSSQELTRLLRRSASTVVAAYEAKLCVMQEEKRFMKRMGGHFATTKPRFELAPAQWLIVAQTACEVLGYAKLQRWQWGTMRDLADGACVVTLAATCSGKSTIWILLVLGIRASRKKMMVILLSVTKAMQIDQVDSLRRIGIDAHAINGDCISDKLVDDFLAGNGELFALTPELLVHNARLRKALVDPAFRERVAAVIMDEGHCLSTWGSTFRPDIARLDQVCVQMGTEIPWAVISATLPKYDLDRAVELLGLNQRPLLGRDTGADRPELRYEIRATCYPLSTNRDLFFLLPPLLLAPPSPPAPPPAPASASSSATAAVASSSFYAPSPASSSPRASASRLEKLASIPKAIVFIHTRAGCDEAKRTFDRLLARHGLECATDIFHALCSQTHKARVLDQFKTGVIRIVFATEAFGNGCDVSGIELCVQYGMPESLVSLLQHWGRAGRVGGGGKGELARPARCIWLADPALFGETSREMEETVKELREKEAAKRAGAKEAAARPAQGQGVGAVYRLDASPSKALPKKRSPRKKRPADRPLFDLLNLPPNSCIRSFLVRHMRPYMEPAFSAMAAIWERDEHRGASRAPEDCCSGSSCSRPLRNDLAARLHRYRDLDFASSSDIIALPASALLPDATIDALRQHANLLCGIPTDAITSGWLQDQPEWTLGNPGVQA